MVIDFPTSFTEGGHRLAGCLSGVISNNRETVQWTISRSWCLERKVPVIYDDRSEAEQGTHKRVCKEGAEQPLRQNVLCSYPLLATFGA